MRNQKKLLVEQLDRKLEPFILISNVEMPLNGWINTIRIALNMTLKQLGERLNITSQGVKDIEQRESKGSITINSLKEVGNALEMKLVYGFIPIHGSIDKLIDLKSKELAEKIISRANLNMQLEDQGNSNQYIKDAIEDLTIEIKREMKKAIWD